MACIAITNQKTDTIMNASGAISQTGKLQGRACTILDPSYESRKGLEAGCGERCCAISLICLVFAIAIAMIIPGVLLLSPPLIGIGIAVFLSGFFLIGKAVENKICC